jgi:hypothetical protein
MTSADEPAVLALNAAAVEQTDLLGPDRLDWLRLIAAHAAVVEIEGEIAAFVLTFAPGSAHDSLDFQWFVSTYADRFLHLDRIVVAEAHRRAVRPAGLPGPVRPARRRLTRLPRRPRLRRGRQTPPSQRHHQRDALEGTGRLTPASR